MNTVVSYFRGSSHDFRQYFGYFFSPKRIKFPAFLYVRLKELFQPCPQSSRLPSILLLGILRGASREGLPLFLDQTEARRGRNFFKPTSPVPPLLSQGLDDIWGSGSCTTGFIFFSNLVNRIWLWTLKDRFNEQRHPVDKTKIKSKPTAFSEHPEHFLSHSDHSHTDMQLIPRGNSFFTWLRTQGEGVTFDMICYPGMELKVRKKFSVTEKVLELLEKNWSSIKRRQLLLFLSADCIACSEFTLRKLDHLS